jgi:hypothetical protein
MDDGTPITSVDALMRDAPQSPATGSLGQPALRTIPPLGGLSTSGASRPSTRAADLTPPAPIKINITGGAFTTDAGTGGVVSGKVTIPLDRRASVYLTPSAVLRAPNVGNDSLRLRLEGGVEFKWIDTPQTKLRAGPYGAFTATLNDGAPDSMEWRLGAAFGLSQRLGRDSPFELYADGKAFLARSLTPGASAVNRFTVEGEGGLRYTHPDSRISAGLSAWGGYNAVFNGTDSAGLALGPTVRVPIQGGPTIVIRAGFTAVGSGSPTPDAGLVGQRDGSWGGDIRLSWDF